MVIYNQVTVLDNEKLAVSNSYCFAQNCTWSNKNVPKIHDNKFQEGGGGQLNFFF